MVLIVVRHGESEWNKLNKFTGWKNPSLSTNGIKEAQIVGKLLQNYKINWVFTSDLDRSIETANIIMENNTDRNYSFKSCEALKERDYGDLTGKNKMELEIVHGKDQINQWRRSWSHCPPNGENLKQVAERVGNFYDNNIQPLLLLNNNSNILIVAHGNSLRALLVHLGIKSETSIESFEIETGVPIKLDIDNKTIEYINRYKFTGTQILDSRGFPTIQAECWDLCENKIIGKGSTPSGASCGSSEVIELRDGDKSKYMGKSVFKAIENINKINSLCLKNVSNLINMDSQLKKMDSSPYKSYMGGNTTTALSFCFSDVGSKINQMELFEYFSNIFSNKLNCTQKLPTPMVNIINGGKHGVTEDLKIQEFMILCNRDYSIDKQIQIICEVYHGLKKILVEKYGPGAKSIGDEGGFCPPIYTANEAIQVISEAIVSVGYLPGVDVFLALDCASSEFYNNETKLYEVEKDLFLTSSQLVSYYENLIDKYPYLISIEDGFSESDYEGWKLFMEKLGSKIMIVGDDLFTTNPSLIKTGLENKLANTLLLKVNQIGTISEAVEGAQLMFNKNNNVIVSHRSGETNHAYIVDLAVGIGAQYLKIGSPCRGERVAKFNRLIEINSLLNNKIIL